MAREWTDLVSELEAHYPTALGAAGQDTRLQAVLVRFANSLFKEIERQRRWSLAYSQSAIVTVAGTQLYAIPAGITAITHLYYLLATGQPVELELYDPQELRRIYGEGAASVRAAPRFFAINGTNLELFPLPDANGSVGSYTLVVEGYSALTPIVETSGATTAASAVLTVPSTAFLTARAVPALGSYLSVRGAGDAGASANDTFFTGWSAFASATQVTMTAVAPSTVAAGAQVFFNSWNWLINDFDKVVLFGVLREVAAYLKENYDVWEKRYQQELELMADYDFDRKKTLAGMMTAVTGQRQAQLAALDRFPTSGAPYGWY